MLSLPTNMSLIPPLDQGTIKTSKAHYAWYSMERIVNAMKKNPDRENIMQVWKDYTNKHTIFIEKAVKAIKRETVNSCLRKLCPDVVHDFTRLTTEPTKEITEEIMDVKKRLGRSEGFQDMDRGEIQELIDAIRGINRR